MQNEVITTKQLEAGPLVLFPRTQISPANVESVDLSDFHAKTLHLAGRGDFRTLEQTGRPRMVFQVFTAQDVQQLDEILGRLLGMNERPSYSGLFVVLFIGNREHMEINQRNHRQVYDHIGSIQDRAAAWCSLYL